MRVQQRILVIPTVTLYIRKHITAIIFITNPKYKTKSYLTYPSAYDIFIRCMNIKR